MSEFPKLAEERLQQSEVASLRAQPLKDGSGWYVELTWRDGRVEHIGTFGSKTTARDWIDWEFSKFFCGKLAH
jgi:hypothetical protein